MARVQLFICDFSFHTVQQLLVLHSLKLSEDIGERDRERTGDKYKASKYKAYRMFYR